MRGIWRLRRKSSAVDLPLPSSGGLNLQPAIKDVVFAHLPKTAGTSLRNSLVEALPDTVKIFNYGRDTQLIKGDFINAFESDATTPEGILALRLKFRRDQRLLLVGHLRVADFIGSFHPASFITFLRHPVDRIVSAYKHRARFLNYKGSFADFYESPGHINAQSRLLSGIDLRDIGFIGLTEFMPEMLTALSRHLGLELKNRKDNISRRSGGPTVDERTRARILALNEEDMRLYRLVEADLDSYTNHRSRNVAMPAMGEITSQGDGAFEGWAAAFHSGGLIEIEVRVGDQVVHRCFADQFMPAMRKGSLAPHGVGGFSVRLPPELLTGQRQIRFVFGGTEKDLDGSPIAL